MTATPLATATIPAEQFAEAHRRLLADPAIQFNLPVSQAPDPPDWIEWLVDTLGPLLSVLFWVAVAGFVLFILIVLVQRATGMDWPWRRRAESEEQDWRPAEGEARRLLEEADALAADGLYADAAHLLLFRSIEDIDQRRPELVRPALTSRDIAALPAIPERPRSAFLAIAMLVERGLFAARPLAAEDWRECRAAYEDFAFAEGWRG